MENPSTQRKTCPNSTLTIRKLTWTDLGSNPAFRGERPATNCLSHGAANMKLTVFLRNDKDLIRTSQNTNCICVKDHFVLYFSYILVYPLEETEWSTCKSMDKLQT